MQSLLNDHSYSDHLKLQLRMRGMSIPMVMWSQCRCLATGSQLRHCSVFVHVITICNLHGQLLTSDQWGSWKKTTNSDQMIVGSNWDCCKWHCKLSWSYDIMPQDHTVWQWRSWSQLQYVSRDYLLVFLLFQNVSSILNYIYICIYLL